MPYRNVVSSQVWNRMRIRKRQFIDFSSTKEETEAPIWQPPSVSLDNKVAPARPDLPGHAWRAHSGVSNR